LEEKQREALTLEAEQGRKWATALEVLGQFCDERRTEIVRAMENRSYHSDELPIIAATLEVINDFRRKASYAIELGQIAEKRLREDKE